MKAELLMLGDMARSAGEKDNMSVAALRWDGFDDMPERTALLLDPEEEDYAPETLVSVMYANALPPELTELPRISSDNTTIFLEGN